MNQSGQKREETYKRYLTPTLKPGLRSTVKDKDLPQIDFLRINKLRVKNNTNGTGK